MLINVRGSHHWKCNFYNVLNCLSFYFLFAPGDSKRVDPPENNGTERILSSLMIFLNKNYSWWEGDLRAYDEALRFLWLKDQCSEILCRFSKIAVFEFGMVGGQKVTLDSY